MRAIFATSILLVPTSALAISTDKPSYLPGEDMLVYCALENQFQIYNLSTSENYGLYACENPTQVALGHGTYALVEITLDGVCNDMTYEECKNADYFVSEYTITSFDTDEIPSGASHDDPDGRYSSYRPEVSIKNPKQDTIFAHTGDVEYVATDKNDRGSEDEHQNLGLISMPVSIYFSDTISEWDHSLIDSSDKTFVVKNLSATGTYAWSIQDLKPGVLYRVIVDAIDALGEVGEDVSDFFTVDFEAPQFSVRVDPPVTRKDDVSISIESSKELSGLPVVTVTQLGGKAVPLELAGEGTHFEGVYHVIPGFDGTAKISVSGIDKAGNKGTQIVSGGTFAVGVEPPPKPELSSPIDGSVSQSGVVSIRGTSREDTKIILTVNGGSAYSAPVQSDGSFEILNVMLSKEVNHGENVISVHAEDTAGLQSEDVTVKIKFNIAPTLSLLKPAQGETIGGKVILDADGRDENNDILKYTFEIIPKNAFNAQLSATSTENVWTVLVEDNLSRRFSWDSTELSDGEYVLRVRATDGIEVAYTKPVNIILHNTLPFIRFEDGRKTVTATTSALIVGRAMVADTGSTRSTITKVEYTRDNGDTWVTIPIEPGEEVRFRITVTNLKEGVNGLQFRISDSRGLVGRTSHPVVVDGLAPNSPSVSAPHSGSVISDSMDSNATMKGMQIAVSGTTNQFGKIETTLNGSTYKGRADIKGGFVIRDIPLLKKGDYTLQTVAIDDAGNRSIETLTPFIYDNAPEVTFLAPKNGRGIGGIAHLSWMTMDKDSDSAISQVLSYRRGNAPFTPLPIAPDARSFEWDVRSFAEGTGYELRLEAGDGRATTSESIAFSVDTAPPAIASFSVAKDHLGPNDILGANGEAEDSLSGIEYVEYAVQKEGSEDVNAEWVRALVTKGFLSRDASFSIRYPRELQDGTYVIAVRAVDASGNISAVQTSRAVVDASPPRVGTLSVERDGIRISPDSEGMLSITAGHALVDVSLENDTNSAAIDIYGERYPLAQNLSNGLWEADIVLLGEGTRALYLSAEDKSGNAFADNKIGSFTVLPSGFAHQSGAEEEPLSGATIEVLRLREETGNYEPFSFGGTSGGRIATDESGNYALTLPAGTYTLIMRKNDYHTVSKIVALEQPGSVNEEFVMSELRGVGGFFQKVSDYLRYEL